MFASYRVINKVRYRAQRRNHGMWGFVTMSGRHQDLIHLFQCDRPEISVVRHRPVGKAACMAKGTVCHRCQLRRDSRFSHVQSTPQIEKSQQSLMQARRVIRPEHSDVTSVLCFVTLLEKAARHLACGRIIRGVPQRDEVIGI
jgi:hypothetical protein